MLFCLVVLAVKNMTLGHVDAYGIFFKTIGLFSFLGCLFCKHDIELETKLTLNLFRIY